MMALRRAIWLTLLLVTAQGCALTTALSDADEPDAGGADMMQAADSGADVGVDLPVMPDMPVADMPDMPDMSEMSDMPAEDAAYSTYQACLNACPIMKQRICVGAVDTAGQPTATFHCIPQDAVAAQCLELVPLPATDLPKTSAGLRSFKPERLLAEATQGGAIAFTRAGGEAQVVLLASAGSRRVTLGLPPSDPTDKIAPVGLYPEAVISLKDARRPEVLVLGRGAGGVSEDGVSDAGAVWYGAFVNPNDINLIASQVHWAHSSDSRFCGASGTNSASFSHIHNANPQRYLGLAALFCNTDEHNRPPAFELQGVDSVQVDGIATAGVVSISSFSAARTLSEDWEDEGRPLLAAVSDLTSFVRSANTQTWGLVRESVLEMGQVRFKLAGWRWDTVTNEWSEERYINLHDAVTRALGERGAQGCPAAGKGSLVEEIERYRSGALRPSLRATASGDLEVALPYIDSSSTDSTPRWLIARFSQDKYDAMMPASLYDAVSVRCVGPLPPPGQPALSGNFLVVDHLPDPLGGVALISERPPAGSPDEQRPLNVRISIKSPTTGAPSEPILLFSQQDGNNLPAVYFTADRLLPSEGGGMQIVGRKLTVADAPTLEVFRLQLSSAGAPLCRPPNL